MRKEDEMIAYENKLFDSARLGINLEDFSRSDVGKYLLEKADREYSTAAEILINTPAEDTEAITEAQVMARVAVAFKRWIHEGITSGRLAEDELRNTEN